MLVFRSYQGPTVIFCMKLVDSMTLLKIKFDQNRGLLILDRSKVKVNDLYNNFFQMPCYAYQLIENVLALF